ncbi:DUF2835 domain-containing protein [Pseudoalteromonas sp. MMG013]|uniref:DUF2835 family protein n=1 Tax=Pseudoalteromonas sp. MMG013 TaxID=2822687 RepID=UPI001B39A035|nr:DUF2835 family protein [Pseudoalteromonas sp. MMG013]MBQ4863391.1 DUF2835 domain-containing protein [Pseudoalteromonas sp. MMG013]
MQEYFFTMYLDYEQCLDFYDGSIKFVQVVEDQGKRIRFPATHVRKFVSSIGIRGRFRLCLDAQSAFISLEKIA